jgi:arginyl-tRNA synthetase
MNIFNEFEVRIKNTIKLVLPEIDNQNIGLDAVVVEPPRDPSHGDLATNAAMVLAKPLGMKPRDIATRIAAGLAATPTSTPPRLRGPASSIFGSGRPSGRNRWRS